LTWLANFMVRTSFSAPLEVEDKIVKLDRGAAFKTKGG
jgi:hypothetical protein